MITEFSPTTLIPKAEIHVEAFEAQKSVVLIPSYSQRDGLVDYSSS